MAIVIDFNQKRKEKIESELVSLKTFGLTAEDVDIIKLYPYIDVKYKVQVDTISGNVKEFIKCDRKRKLFDELTRVSKGFESERVAWIVIEKDVSYLYIKELDKIFKAENDYFEKRVKSSLYEYGIDYLILLEKVSGDMYRWVAV